MRSEPGALQDTPSVNFRARYMAEISDDMDRTRATTAAKAAYEAGRVRFTYGMFRVVQRGGWHKGG